LVLGFTTIKIGFSVPGNNPSGFIPPEYTPTEQIIPTKYIPRAMPGFITSRKNQLKIMSNNNSV
jgi:hypothetical protein